MGSRFPLSLLQGDQRRLRRLLRVVWNTAERRPRAPIRLGIGVILIFLFASIASQFRTEPLGGNNPVLAVLNDILWVLPQAIGIGLGVVLACSLIDRRLVTDLGLDLDQG